jgi:hypothetical protein
VFIDSEGEAIGMANNKAPIKSGTTDLINLKLYILTSFSFKKAENYLSIILF